MKKSGESLLYEVGFEEVPSDYFSGIHQAILKFAPELLAECGYRFDEIHFFTTPRRLVISLSGLVKEQASRIERLGPLKSQAYQDGKPTPALTGFLKSTGKREEEIVMKDTLKGQRLSVEVEKELKPLQFFFEQFPKTISFPKLMRWESEKYLFTRPIRWSFAFLGRRKQNFRIANVKSDNVTFGHRFLAPRPVRIQSSNLIHFVRKLKNHHVILCTKERIKSIRKMVGQRAAQDEPLVQMVANLVEEPCRVQGVFDKEYLSLPEPVLKTCMRKHQKIFAQYDVSGKLTNKFVAIINGPRKNPKLIARHYESVLKSRLEDARFFFQEDRKIKLEKQVEKLKDMVFLGSLGSYLDKTKRLEELTVALAKECGQSDSVTQCVKRAARLAKADLVTHLVYEFPELQGIAGFEYACLDQENREVARAIRDHYLPENLSISFEELGKTVGIEGAILGVCERIDLLTGALGLNVELSSSEDPYALRRAGGALVKLIRAHELKFSMKRLIQFSRDQFGSLISKTAVEIQEKLTPFFKERIAFELHLKTGSAEHELLEAIFASGFDDLSQIYLKFNELNQIKTHESFRRACKVMERTGNILKGARTDLSSAWDDALFQEPCEQVLAKLVKKNEESIKKLALNGEFSKAVLMFGDVFFEPVHEFFDRVLVNAEDPKIRVNRHMLVNRVNQLCKAFIADLSKLTNS